jgi:HEAT repeat protein
VDAAATAQEAYRLMLRRYIVPALRTLGFRRGLSTGAFRYETATHACEVRFIKSRGSTPQYVHFWAGLHTSDLKTEFVYWKWQLHSLAPEPLIGWMLEAGEPVEPVASEVLRVFHGYGWPAIQAALDNPGYPCDPAARWARTFPKIPRGPLFDDEVAAERRSYRTLDEATAQADSDSRAFQTVLNLLETDPHPGVRHAAAWFLLHRAADERARQALRAAATEDEDVQVRWVARYAFRLVERQTSTDAARPAPE